MKSRKPREALRTELQHYDEKELEDRHKAEYRKAPPEPGEFDIQEEDRAWGDEAWNDG